MIGIIYALLFTAVLLVALIIKSNQYSTYLIMNNDGYLISDSSIVKNLFQTEMELENADYEAYEFSISDIVYEKAGEFFMGDEKKKILGEFPLFVNNESALFHITDSSVLISENFEEARTYSGLYINNGLSFNPDMERAYRDEFILLALSNGLFINTQTIDISGDFFYEHVLHNNSIIRFLENEIRYYSLSNGVFKPGIIKPVNSNTQITIDNVTYGYYDFLEKLGLYEKGELLEKEVELQKELEENLEASATPLPEKQKATEGPAPTRAVILKEKEEAQEAEEAMTTATPEPSKKAPTKAPQKKDSDKKIREADGRQSTPQDVKKPALPEEAPLPELTEAVTGTEPSTNWSPQEPEPPYETPEEKPEWVMPKVTLGDFIATVYSIKSPGMVIENTQYLYRTGVSFSVYQGNKLVMRKSYLESGDVSIGPLQPDTEYKVVVEMDYLDKIGLKKTELVYETEIRTRPLSELEPLRLNWTNGNIYYDKIQLKDLTITNAIVGSLPDTGTTGGTVDRNIYLETVQYISRVEVLLTSKQNASVKFVILVGSKDLADLRTGKKVLYETTGKINSNTEYTYEFSFYDRFGNSLPIDGLKQGESHTCKQPPKAVINMIKNEVKDIVMGIQVKNPDEAMIVDGSIYFTIFDRYNNPVMTTISRKIKDGIYDVQYEYSESHALSLEGNTIEFHDLLDYEVYKICIYCSYDINDNFGIYEYATIGEMTFTTMPISALGYAFFKVEVLELLDNSASFRISMDTGRTDSRLVSLISDLEISFTDSLTNMGTGINVTYYKEGDTIPEEISSDTGSVILTEEELAQLKTVDEVSGLSSSYIFHVDQLNSKTKYNINIIPRVMMGTVDNHIYRKIDTYYMPNSFTTLKKFPVIEIDAIYASSDFIKLYGVKVSDPDEAVVGYPVTVAVYDDEYVQIASYEIPSANPVYSIDVKNLTRDREYTFRFFAKEFNNGYDMTYYRKNYELYYSELFETKEYLKIKTKEAVTGSIQIQGLDDLRLNKTIEVPVTSITSHNKSVYLYWVSDAQAYRFSSNSQTRAKYSMEVNFGDGQWNSFQIAYSYVSKATDYNFYLEDPDKNPGAQPFATYRAAETRGSSYMRWSEVSFLKKGFTLSGTQTIYLVATTADGTGGINCLWGIRFHQAVAASTGNLNADLNVKVNDPRGELGEIPAYKLKIYEDDVWIDTRRHEWKVNPDGSYTLYMYQIAPDQTLTLVDSKTFSGSERNCDTNFYYEVRQGRHTYRFELWITVYNYEVQLDEEEFTTEEEIVPIRTPNDLADVRYGLAKRYFVLNDIEYPLSWSNITASQAFQGELDFRGHKLTYNSTTSLILTIGHYGSLKNLVLTYGEDWGKDTLRNTDRIVTYNYGTITNIFVSRNNGNVSQTYKEAASAICYTNYETGIIENFVVELPDPMIVTNTSGGVCVYNRGIIRNGYIYGEPLRIPPKENLTEDQYSSNKYIGGVVAVNRQTGIVENVYSLVDVETRPVKSANDYAFTVIGINDGIYRNSFSASDVYYGGEIRQDYGPAYRNRYAGGRAYNVYYYSEVDYGNTNNKKIAKLLLHDTQWYHRLFNTSGSTKTNQMKLGTVQMGYYPHVVWPDFMPAQTYIPLPEIDELALPKVIDASVMEQTYDYAKVLLTFENPDKLEITKLDVRWLNTTILSQEVDGKFYRVTVRLTQPAVTKYYSEYEITGFTYSLGYRGLERTMIYETGEEPKIPVEFYKPITSVEDWNSIKEDYGQNYRLEADLDFYYIPSKMAVVEANVTLDTSNANFKLDAFSGKLDGNGHIIRGIDAGTYGYVIGKLTGTVKNLTIEDLNLESGTGQYKGFIGRMLEGSLVDNVHIIGMKAVSYQHCGAIAGDVYAGTIVNSSAHNVKISTKADGNYAQYVGGLVGKHRQSGNTTIYANITIKNCYVDGINIEVLEAGDCGGVGGMIGFIRASAEIYNVYVVNGFINTVYKNAGGLIGSIDTYTNSESNRYMLKDYYVDVDIRSITERCGGIIGYCIVENGEPEENGLALGNIVTSLPDSKESGRFYGYNLYPGAMVYGYQYSILNGKLPSEDYLLTYEKLCDKATYEIDGELYWDSSFIRNNEEIARGILPKLSFTTSSEPLPYQVDYRLENEPIKITSVSSTNYSTGDLYVVRIEMQHGSDIEVLSADFEGFREADLTGGAVTRVATPTETILEYILALDGYYDAYYLTKLNYRKIETGENLTQQTYLNTGIAPQYLKIADKDEWNTKLAKENFGLKGYNIQIIGDIDFTDGSAASGIVVNHVMGGNLQKGNYYKIKNIKMENKEESLFKAVYGNVSYLDFENVTIGREAKKGEDGTPILLNSFGIFEAVTGEIHDVNFKKIDIKTVDCAYVGIAGLTYGMNYNLDLSGVTVHNTFTSSSYLPAKRATGSLTGRLSGAGGIYDTKATDIVVEGREYVGGILGTQEDGRYLSNIEINNAAIYSTNGSYSYVGGIVGYANVNALANVFSNCSVKNAVVIGSSYVGGVVGIGSPMGDYTAAAAEKDKYQTLSQQVFVAGTGSYVGGIAGQGVVQRATVRNAYVYGVAYIGGITGNGSCYYVYVTDSTIGSVYDRLPGDDNRNGVLQDTVNDKIDAYKKLLEDSTDDQKNKVYNAAKTALGYLVTTSRKNSWSTKSYTGNNNTRIGGISARTISVANSMVVNSRIGSYGAVSVGGIVARTELSSYNIGTYRIISSGTINCEIYGAEDVGGIVGSHLRAYIESCYSNSNVTASRVNAGGIAGRVKATNLYSLSETPYFSHMYYLGTVQAEDYAGGIVGKMEQDLYNVNQGLLMGGNVIVTSPTGTASFFMNKYLNDARKLTNCLLYEDAEIIRGTASQTAKQYVETNSSLLLEAGLTTTSELRLKNTYISKLGWNTDEGTTSSNYTTRYFRYDGLLKDYMPYLTHTPTNNYQMSSAIRVLPFQEGYQPDNKETGKAKVDEDGLYVYKYEQYDGGVPIPGSGATIIKKKLLVSRISDTVPRAEFYTVDADRFNIEFTSTNEDATLTVLANGVTVIEKKIDRRTFTVQYDFRTELEIVVTDGQEEIRYTLWPEDISRNVMTWKADYYYIKANEIAGNRVAINGQYLNLYAGHAVDVYGKVIDVETGAVIRTIDEIKVIDEVVPFHTFEYDGYVIQTFKTYSMVNNIIRDKLRMYVKNGELSAISSDLPVISDSLILDNYNGNKYCTVLSVDGIIVDMTDSAITFPDEFDNQEIQYMTNNINSESHLLLVRYYDGAVAGFNYITGELLPIDSPRGTSTRLVDMNGLTKRSNNVSMTNFATLYIDAMEFKNNITDIGWAEVSGANLVSGDAVSEADATVTKDTSMEPLNAAAISMYVESSFKLDDGTTVAANIKANNAANGNLAQTEGLIGTNVANETAGATGLNATGQMQTGLSDEQAALEILSHVLNEEASIPSISTDTVTGKDITEELANILAAIAVIEKYGASLEDIAKLEEVINNLAAKGVLPEEIERLQEALKAAAAKYGLDLNKDEPGADESLTENPIDDSIEVEKAAEVIKEEATATGASDAGADRELAVADKTQVDKQNKTNIKEKQKQYIAVYDTLKNEYVIYEKTDLLTKEDEELESVNDKVERSGHMIDYRAKQKADKKNPGDENIYGYILLSVAITGIALLLCTLLFRKQKEAVE